MTGARVLVIDDNAVNRSILAEQMTAWNFDGASTSTGAQGLEVMRNVIANGMSLDLVILDYQMPEMSGAEVLEVMRKDDALKDIPVVMLTSVDSSQTNQRLSQLGAEANLTKPTRSSMLLETILQVIANKRADVKTHSINNLTAKPTADTINIELPKEQTAQVVKKASEGLDILVAEDNEVNQIVFRQILEETNLNFEIVDNGRLALATYKAQKPRLILMDVSMPEMNGKEATSAIRKYEREKNLKRTPIVGVTAHALKGDMESCIDAGMDDYLSKPVSPNKLSLKIEQWLKINLGNAITG
jgi:CheY-like chemotaxis protein